MPPTILPRLSTGKKHQIKLDLGRGRNRARNMGEIEMLRENMKALTFGTALSLTVGFSGAHAQETIKLGLSVPLSGAGAVWGKGSEFMCKKAAQEVNQAGGVKAKGKTYNFECLAYDNKYNAAEGTRV